MGVFVSRITLKYQAIVKYSCRLDGSRIDINPSLWLHSSRSVKYSNSLYGCEVQKITDFSKHNMVWRNLEVGAISIKYVSIVGLYWRWCRCSCLDYPFKRIFVFIFSCYCDLPFISDHLMVWPLPRGRTCVHKRDSAVTWGFLMGVGCPNWTRRWLGSPSLINLIRQAQMPRVQAIISILFCTQPNMIAHTLACLPYIEAPIALAT